MSFAGARVGSADLADARRPTPATIVMLHQELLVASALAALVTRCEGMRIVALAKTLRAAFGFIERCNIDVLIADARFSSQAEIDKLLLARQSTCRAVLLTPDMRDRSVAEFITSLADVVRNVRSRQGNLMPLRPVNPLTDTERFVLRLAADGETTSVIGQKLGLAHGTVRNYLSNAIRKMESVNSIKAAKAACERGWL